MEGGERERRGEERDRARERERERASARERERESEREREREREKIEKRDTHSSGNIADKTGSPASPRKCLQMSCIARRT